MIVAAAGLLTVQTAWAACDSDSIDTLSDDGDLITLTSGQSYDVSAGDETTSESWQEGDSVLVCNGGETIVDTDQGGEQVDVTQH